MYVPSESVYYELVNMLDIMDFAKQSRVYIVSPTTLYAHLQTILLAFEGKKIESRSRDLFKMLRALQVDFNKVEENMLVLGKHINNASSQFANVNSGFSQIGQKINSTKSLENEVEK
jgi:DNA recombination protein RmuC